MKFTVGSIAFFSNYPDFKPKDKDTLIFVKNPTFKLSRQVSIYNHSCLFQWKLMSPEEYIENTTHPLEVGKFLVPEVCEYIGFTIEHLKQLKPLLDEIDEKHQYQKIIFDSYIENNEFKLTKEQLDSAFDLYKKIRIKNQ